MQPGPASGRHPPGMREALLAFLGYGGAAAIVWWPLVAAPAAVYSVGRDFFQNVWNLWWVRHAWENGLPFFTTDRLFHPGGTSLAFHTLSLANSLPGLAVQDLFGPAAAHSLLLFAAFPLSALAAWALVRHLTGSAWGAFLGGLFYAFSPYHTAMVTQLNNVQFQWIPLFLLALVLFYERGRWWHAAWGGVALALAGYADWYQPVLAVMAGAALLLVLMLRDRRLADRRLWQGVLGLGILAILLALPGILPLVRVMGAEGAQLNVGVRFAGQMSLAGVHPQGSPNFHFWPVVLGWSTCLLAGWAAWRARDPALRPWWWLLAVAFLFLQGPYLVVGPYAFPSIPMPMALFPHLPVLSVVRVPHRFLILVTLALAVIAAFGLREILARLPAGRPRWRGLAGAAACALLFVELQPPERTPAALRPAGIYAEMAADRRDYAVLELPFDFKDGYTMFLQARHRKALLGGYTSHTLPSAVAELQRPLMRALMPRGKDYEVDYMPAFLEVDAAALDDTARAEWRRQLEEDFHVRVIVFRSAPDFRMEAAAPGPSAGLRKWWVALAPFCLNDSARDVEQWRRKAAAEAVRDMADRSAQAHSIVTALYGPPDRVEGGAEIWDLRRR